MARGVPMTMLVTYHPKKGKAEVLRKLVEEHWRTLQELELVTDDPVRIWRATDKKTGEVSFVEMFTWRDEESSRVAHETPEVMAIWEPMVLVLEELGLQRIEPLEPAAGRRSRG